MFGHSKRGPPAQQPKKGVAQKGMPQLLDEKAEKKASEFSLKENAKKISREYAAFLEREAKTITREDGEEKAKAFLETVKGTPETVEQAYAGIAEKHGEIEARAFFETMQKIAGINTRIFASGIMHWKEIMLDTQKPPTERQLIEVAEALNAAISNCENDSVNTVLLQEFFHRAFDLKRWNLWKIQSYFDAQKRKLDSFTAMALLEAVEKTFGQLYIDLNELVDKANCVPDNAQLVFNCETPDAQKWIEDAFSRIESTTFIVKDTDAAYYKNLATILAERPMGIVVGGDQDGFSTDCSSVYIPRMFDKFNSRQANERTYRNAIYHEAEGHVKGKSFVVNLCAVELEKLGYKMRDELDYVIEGKDGKIVKSSDGKPFKVKTTMDLLWFFGDYTGIAKDLLNIVEDKRADARVVENNPGYSQEYMQEHLDLLEFRSKPKDANKPADVVEAFMQKLLVGKTNTELTQELQERVNKLMEITERAPADAPDATLSFNATIELVEQLKQWFGEKMKAVAVRQPFRPHEAPHNLNVPVLSKPQKKEARSKRTTPGNENDDGKESKPSSFPESEFRPDWSKGEGKAEAGKGVFDEWDYKKGGYVIKACKVVEEKPEQTKRPDTDPTLKNIVRNTFERIKPREKTTLKRQPWGEVDPEELMKLVITTATGKVPDIRVFQHTVRNKRSVCFGILKDASGSTSATVNGRKTVSDVEDEAMDLFATAARAIGDPTGLWAYNSSGKENTKFYVIQDFEEKRFSSVKPDNSNRDGAAIRVATKKLLDRLEKDKVLLIISDLKPADTNYDGKYAFEDTKKAIFEARMQGVRVFGIVVREPGKKNEITGEQEDKSHEEAQEMYGPGCSIVISDVRELPEKMPYLYSLLAGL